jgi:hypothetical protein
MWPFEQLRERKYERRYNAALIVLLGNYMMAHLSADQRKQVESEVDANMNRTDAPAIAWRRVLGASDTMAAFRAVAMQKAGIAPIVAGLSWGQLFRPRSLWRIRTLWPFLRGFDMLPITLVKDFRPMHQATTDARAFLRHHGLDVPYFDRWEGTSRQRNPASDPKEDRRAT